MPDYGFGKEITRLFKFSTPELCDGGDGIMVMDYQIKPRAGKQKIAGFALTVQVPPGEGGIVADAIMQAGPGDVIVVAGGGNCNCAYWGDHRSYCAKLKRAAGVVIDGGFRDLEGCNAIGFPVYARGLTCISAKKSGEGEINVPVECGNVLVRPGDIMVGDENGVCVIRPEDAKGIIEGAKRKIAAQNSTVEEMKRTGKILTKVKIYP